MDTAAAEADIKDAIGDCPVCLEPILDPPIHQVFLAIKKLKDMSQICNAFCLNFVACLFLELNFLTDIKDC